MGGVLVPKFEERRRRRFLAVVVGFSTFGVSEVRGGRRWKKNSHFSCKEIKMLLLGEEKGGGGVYELSHTRMQNDSEICFRIGITFLEMFKLP